MWPASPRMIYPFLRRADREKRAFREHADGFIPSCEGQASVGWMYTDVMVIHPFLRRADETTPEDDYYNNDSSLLTKGRH